MQSFFVLVDSLGHGFLVHRHILMHRAALGQLQCGEVWRDGLGAFDARVLVVLDAQLAVVRVHVLPLEAWGLNFAALGVLCRATR